MSAQPHEVTVNALQGVRARTEPAGPPAGELAGIARRFNRRWVLRGVSLRVDAGEAVALMGRNGSGKTTLLRILSTALSATRGNGMVYGHDLRGDAAGVRELVGILGHAAGLYEDLTAYENLRFALRMTGLTVVRDQIRAALATVGLAHEENERVRNFSAGMRRRLGLAKLAVVGRDLALLGCDLLQLAAPGLAQRPILQIRRNHVGRDARDARGLVINALLAHRERFVETVDYDYDDPARYTNSVHRTNACVSCHGDIKSFDFPRQDYDGNGLVEGIQTEVKGLLAKLALLLPPVGVAKDSISINSSWTRQQLRAGYNYLFVLEDGSFGAQAGRLVRCLPARQCGCPHLRILIPLPVIQLISRPVAIGSKGRKAQAGLAHPFVGFLQ